MLIFVTYFLSWAPTMLIIAQVAITKYQRLGGYSRYIFLMVLEPRKSKIKVLADSVLGEGSLRGLQMAAFSLCPHKVNRRNSGVSSFSNKGTKPIMGAPSLISHLNLITSQRPHLLTPSHWGLGLQHMNFGRHKHAVHGTY